MAKKILINDDVQVHDFLSMFPANDDVRVLSEEGKPLFTIDEYFEIDTLRDDYGERKIKSASLIENGLEVRLWL